MSGKLEKKYMRTALRLAKFATGNTTPNPLVGAVVVKNGKIIGKGYHKFAGAPHAEIEAIRNAGKNLKGAELYVNLEPCSSYGRTPPCTDAIIKSGIKKVVFGILDPNPKHRGKAVEILRNAGIEVLYPILEDECRELNEAFFKWISTGLPFINLKLALTLDAKIADEYGNSKWITSEKSRHEVQKLRLQSDAIMIGAETLKKDNPSLTVRSFKKKKQPLRIVVSDSLSPLTARKLFSSQENGGEIRVINPTTKEEWLEHLKSLARENILSILVEGGSKLASTLLQLQLIDKIHLHYAPLILGSGKNAFNLERIPLSNALKIKNAKYAKCGSDFHISGYPEYKNI